MGKSASLAEAQASAYVLEQALCHASLVIERLIFYAKNFGLLPRVSESADPLSPIVVGDDDVTIITRGFRRISSTGPRQRWQLLADPFAEELTQSRQQFLNAIEDEQARSFGLSSLLRAYELTSPALDAFLIALAPDLDSRTSRLFGYLNNDISLRRPTLGHLHMAVQPHLPALDTGLLGLLDGSLLAHGLVVVNPSADLPSSSRTVQVPPHILDLCQSFLSKYQLRDASPSWDRLHFPASAKTAMRHGLLREMSSRTGAHRRLILFEGPTGSGRRAAALATAEELSVPVFYCNLADQRRGNEELMERELHRVFLCARLTHGLVLIRSDGLLKGKEGLVQLLGSLQEKHDLPCLVLVYPDEFDHLSMSVRFVRISPPFLRPENRRSLWIDVVTQHSLQVSDANLDDISTRYALTPGRIEEVGGELALRRPKGARTSLQIDDVRTALRDITTHKLRDMATFVEPEGRLEDLVLPENTTERLEEIIFRLRYRYKVLDAWRFGRRNAPGHGVAVMFSGPSGTGKTASAKAICNNLQIDLYVVDLSKILSKWVGETEQNLARIFDEAEASSAALLFDEADSIFGKRGTDIKSSSDRYANVTVSYLLERMERYSGLTILTTNLESAIDQAFMRRLSARVDFPEPDREQSLRLWQALLPQTAKFGDDVDLSQLVTEYKLPGARIRNTLVRAAFFSAAAGQQTPVLTQEDLLSAAAAEYEDMGRLSVRRQTVEPSAAEADAESAE